jgi:hypothetical protein
MNEKTKLILALTQIENIANLISENKYERFLINHLVSIKCEIERQMSLLNHGKEIV